MNTRARLPVIIGVGQVNDRSDNPDQSQDACQLMLEALRRADADAGGHGLDGVDTLELVELFSASMDGIVGRLSSALPGLRRTPEFVAGHGNTPLLLLNRAANRIAAGEAEICAIAGAEAFRSDKRRAAQATGPRGPDMMMSTLEGVTSVTAKKYGLVTPIQIYPLFENAMRAHWKQTLHESQGESARIWSEFSAIAAENEHAWIRRRHTEEQILETGPSNRKLSFPYSTLTVANNSVNQGAAIILASVEAATRLGIPESNWVYVGQGAAASESHDFRERQDYFSSPSLEVTLHEALERNGIGAADCDLLELYSCFPCVPKYARRVEKFRSHVPLTVSGGLTFAGGPIRNYMMHATAAMVEKLRREGRYGLLFGNGGFMTDAHAIALGKQAFAAAQLPASFDVQGLSDAARRAVPRFVEDYLGEGTIETYTVEYERDGTPAHGTIIGRNAQGERFVCRARGDDADLIAALTSGESEPVGRSGRVIEAADGYRLWQMR